MYQTSPRRFRYIIKFFIRRTAQYEPCEHRMTNTIEEIQKKTYSQVISDICLLTSASRAIHPIISRKLNIIVNLSLLHKKLR